MSEQLTEMAKSLRALKDEKEQLEAKLKEVNGGIRKLAEGDIPEYMEDNEIDKVSIEGVGTIYLSTKVYAHVKAENREPFFEWLREHGNGDLIKETVHPSTLNAFAKEQLSEGHALPDQLIDAKLYQTANLRRK